MACVASPEKWKKGGKSPSVATTFVWISSEEGVFSARSSSSA